MRWGMCEMKGLLVRYCSFIERHGGNGAAAMALLLLVLSVAGMAVVVGRFVGLMHGVLPLDLTLFYGMVQAKTFFAQIPAAASAYYLYTVASADMVFPLAYGVSLGFIVAWLLSVIRRHGRSAPRWLIAYALIPAALDYWENAGIVAALHQQGQVPDMLVFTTMIASGLKWTSALAGFAVLAWLIVQAARPAATGENK
jgi:hypothetical protein